MPAHARHSRITLVGAGLGLFVLAQAGCAKETWSLATSLALPDFTLDATHPTVAYTITTEVTPECFPVDEEVAYGPTASAYVRALDDSGIPGEPVATAAVDLTVASAVPTPETVDLTVVGQREHLYVGVSGLSDPGCSLDCLCRDRGVCTLSSVLTFRWVSGGRVAGDRATVTALVAGSREGEPPDDARLTLEIEGVGHQADQPGCSASGASSGWIGIALLAPVLLRAVRRGWFRSVPRA